MLQIRWHGHSCFEITNDITLVTDPHDGKSIGIPAPSVTGDVILVSHDHYDHNSVKSVEKEGSKVVTDERKRNISDVEIRGVESFHEAAIGALVALIGGLIAGIGGNLVAIGRKG